MFCVQSPEVEESQQLENPAGAEASGLFAEQEQQLTRSSSTSDITEQFPPDFLQGNSDHSDAAPLKRKCGALSSPISAALTGFAFQPCSKMCLYLGFSVNISLASC